MLSVCIPLFSSVSVFWHFIHWYVMCSGSLHYWLCTITIVTSGMGLLCWYILRFTCCICSAWDCLFLAIVALLGSSLCEPCWWCHSVVTPSCASHTYIPIYCSTILIPDGGCWRLFLPLHSVIHWRFVMIQEFVIVVPTLMLFLLQILPDTGCLTTASGRILFYLWLCAFLVEAVSGAIFCCGGLGGGLVTLWWNFICSEVWRFWSCLPVHSFCSSLFLDIVILFCYYYTSIWWWWYFI